MPRITYNKLIRDLIPEIISADNATPKISILSDEQFSLALKQKVVEEAMELLEAKGREDILGELADLLELVDAIQISENITAADVADKKFQKRLKRGGFDKKLFLEFVDEADKK
jgi:predicted house-cleaning noncanonical NTP pyrophosphatase (MazG superfamily)